MVLLVERAVDDPTGAEDCDLVGILVGLRPLELGPEAEDEYQEEADGVHVKKNGISVVVLWFQAAVVGLGASFLGKKENDRN